MAVVGLGGSIWCQRSSVWLALAAGALPARAGTVLLRRGRAAPAWPSTTTRSSFRSPSRRLRPRPRPHRPRPRRRRCGPIVFAEDRPPAPTASTATSWPRTSRRGTGTSRAFEGFGELRHRTASTATRRSSRRMCPAGSRTPRRSEIRNVGPHRLLELHGRRRVLDPSQSPCLRDWVCVMGPLAVVIAHLRPGQRRARFDRFGPPWFARCSLRREARGSARFQSWSAAKLRYPPISASLARSASAAASRGVSASAVRWPIFRPAWRLGLAVEVKLDVRQRERRGPVGFAAAPTGRPAGSPSRRGAEPCVPQRQPAHRAQLLLELAGHARVEREMPRSCAAAAPLVDQQLPRPGEEELHAQHADDVELFQNAARDFHRLARDRRRHVGRGDREVEDVVAMRVLDHAPVGERRRPPARGDDGDLALEVDERFIDRTPPPTAAAAVALRVGRRADLPLPLAVVPERRRSSAPPGTPSSPPPRPQLVAVRTARNGVTGNPWLARNVFSRSRCCVVWSTCPAGRTGAARSAAAAVALGHVLELERHHAHAARERSARASRSS